MASEPTKSDKKKILLVDDDQEIIESMRVALGARGHEVVVARDGNQGLAMIEREDPDMLILDMMMPKRSGFLVLERLRRTRPVPMRIIMITANEGSRHKAYAEMLGVDDYIRKPFAMDRLLDSVDRLLGTVRKKSKSESQTQAEAEAKLEAKAEAKPEAKAAEPARGKSKAKSEDAPRAKPKSTRSKKA